MIFDIERKSDLFFQVFHHLCDAGLCVTEFCAYTGKAAVIIYGQHDFPTFDVHSFILQCIKNTKIRENLFAY